MPRVLALDYGKKRIGLALSDLLQITASPFDVIERESFKKDALKILEIAKANEVGTVVIGLPINMDGTESEMSEFVKSFIAELQNIAGDIEIKTIDERLTTAQAERMLTEEFDISRSKRKGVRDKIAASIILQVYLDSKAF
ncbi:MAG: Holliday junction resolvase RuvX [Elusimicrobia bacterium]|nr:Holliday junction resolvase RuvX [Elusimicrobiota bacterium]